MNFNTIVVFDTETDGVDIEVCNMWEVAALAIDARTLEIIPNSELNLFMRPVGEVNESGLKFHARLRKRKPEDVLEEWMSYPHPDTVWPEFVQYLYKHHKQQTRRSRFSAPIPAGTNIRKFDIPLVNRYHTKFGSGEVLFHVRDEIDLLDRFFAWFENSGEVEKYNMDYMREYFGISSKNAHTGLQDVKDCANIIIRFQKLYRKFSKQVQFKGAFKNA